MDRNKNAKNSTIKRNDIVSIVEELKKEVEELKKEVEELKKEVEELKKEEVEEVKKEEVEEVKKENKKTKLEEYNLNKKKVNLQRSKNPKLYKLLEIYLTATTIIGILLAVYYIFFYSKG
jgi:predicted ATP-dependent endonuclease of OLD family